uniref:Uncharacterized protein n=1 Tax=Heterorhabditis bacteriophora TaxID=37862 RepID=A0A1I7WNG6_HETBA
MEVADDDEIFEIRQFKFHFLEPFKFMELKFLLILHSRIKIIIMN